MDKHLEYIERAVELAVESVEENKGGPFGAIVVKNGKIIAEAVNQVTCNHDPTAHAEVQAIRKACKELGNHQLDDCVIYSSCEPCPMCMGAIYWARPKALFFAASKEDASSAGFDDSYIYDELGKPTQERLIRMEKLDPKSSLLPFNKWKDSIHKIEY